jgi:arylsulfatase
MAPMPAIRFLISLTLLAFCYAAHGDERPNILLIVADDLGFSDIGVYGSEINTPNIDALAAGGLLLTNFYAQAVCAQTRSMLLTGIDNHLTGYGTSAVGLNRAPELRGRPGYEGYLNDRVVTVPTLLQRSGYRTLMVGKWHLSKGEHGRPEDRGFDQSFALLGGGASHFSDARATSSVESPAVYSENGQVVDQLPKDFYSTHYYTDRMIDYIESGREDDRPFFAYMSYTSVHWPLQLPDDWIDKYVGRYEQGWDRVREERLHRMKELGIMPSWAELSRRSHGMQPWDELSATARRVEMRRMEIYAAMVENLDHHIGRLLQYLDDSGQRDNTLIIFMSDNGAEGNDVLGIADNRYWVPANFDLRFDAMGRQGSYTMLGPGWAQTAVTPFSLYKSFMAEGGIHVPAIISAPGEARRGRSDEIVTVVDLAAGILDVAGKEHPGSRFEGRDVSPIQGRSFLPWLSGDKERLYSDDEGIGWEVFGGRGLRRGKWKITWSWPPYGPGRWQLYDLEQDPGSVHDLAEDNPDQLASMVAEWDEYARTNNVFVFERDVGYGR